MTDGYQLHVDISDKDALHEYELLKVSEGTLNTTPNCNKIVLKFQQDEFYKQEKLMFSMNADVRNRLIANRVKYLGKPEDKITDAEYLRGFKISGIYQSYSHFSPRWSKYFVEMNGLTCVADPFGGWGHHLLGMCAAGTKVYYNDFSKPTVENVQKIVSFLKLNCDVRFGDARSFVVPDDCDGVFMCPPYFNQEVYTCGAFESIDAYNFIMQSVIGNILESKASVLGVIIREDYDYLFSEIFNKCIAKEPVNRSRSHFSKGGKRTEFLYTFYLK